MSQRLFLFLVCCIKSTPFMMSFIFLSEWFIFGFGSLQIFVNSSSYLFSYSSILFHSLVFCFFTTSFSSSIDRFIMFILVRKNSFFIFVFCCYAMDCSLDCFLVLIIMIIIIIIITIITMIMIIIIIIIIIIPVIRGSLSRLSFTPVLKRSRVL